MGEIGRELFRGPGMIIIQLMFLAVGTYIAEFVVAALGKKQYSKLIVAGGLFAGFSLVLYNIGKALAEAARVMGFN